MRFKVGDKAIYPSHGVATIEKVESKEVGGEPLEFYVFKIDSSGAKVLVPVMGSEKAGVRHVLPPDEICNILDILRSPAQNFQRPWNKRFKEFNDKIKTGSVTQLAEVTRDLSAIQSRKDLSFGERKLFEKCMSLLVDEIKASKGDESSISVSTEIYGALRALA